MYPAELKDLLWRFKAPRFVTATVVGGSLNDEKARKDLGLGSCGRIIFATGNELVESMVVPANCIPYASQRTAYWDDRQKRFTEGGLARGWLITLSSLVRDGLLIPHSKLLYLIGRPRDFARKPV